MDLAKLAEMAEESQNKFNDKILHICDPNKIAAELMKSLERAAVKAANNGEYTATASYELSFWEADEDPDSHRYFNEVKRGFLSKVKSGDEKRFCATLIEMLEECIVNKNIHLELKKYDKQSATHFKFSTSIQATLSWAENAYEGNPFETIEKFKKATPESNEDEKQKLAVKRERISKYQGCVSVGAGYTFGLKTDGTIVVRKERQSDHCNVSDWRDIVAFAAGAIHTIGLKADGKVVSVGDNREGKSDVSKWSDITAIAAGGSHTVGLKPDGKVVAVGDHRGGRCDVSRWTGIVAIAAGDNTTIGLKSNGTVVATGVNSDGQCNVSDWNNIVVIDGGQDHVVGLMKNGTVVATGKNLYGQCDVYDWQGVIAVSAGYDHSAGLKVDGTVIAVGNNEYGQCNVSDWRNIVAVFAGSWRTIGLKSNGTVIEAGRDKKQYDWQNIGPVPEEEKAKMVARIIEENIEKHRKIEEEKRRKEKEKAYAEAKAEADRQRKRKIEEERERERLAQKAIYERNRQIYSTVFFGLVSMFLIFLLILYFI